jgi:hypothetical protein
MTIAKSKIKKDLIQASRRTPVHKIFCTIPTHQALSGLQSYRAENAGISTGPSTFARGTTAQRNNLLTSLVIFDDVLGKKGNPNVHPTSSAFQSFLHDAEI